MPTTSKNDQARTLPSLFISLLIHAAIIFLIPFVGAPQIGLPNTSGGSLKVTMIMPTTPSETISTTDTRKPVSSPPSTPAAVTQVQPPSLSKQVSNSRVITSTNPVTSTKVSSDNKVEATSEATLPIIPSEPANSPNGDGSGTSAPPDPPYGGDVIAFLPNLGFPKDGHTLTTTTTFTLIVRVSAEGTWENAVKIQPVKQHYLDNWAVKATQQALRYSRLGEPYEVTIGIVLNPYTRAVNFDVPKERVRILSLQ